MDRLHIVASEIKTPPFTGLRLPKSKLAALIPDAIEIRKSTGATWRDIARELSEREGVKIPYSSLYEVSTTWIKKRRELDALPDPQSTGKPRQGRGVASPESMAVLPAADDLEDSPKKLIVKTRKKP